MPYHGFLYMILDMLILEITDAFCQCGPPLHWSCQFLNLDYLSIYGPIILKSFLYTRQDSSEFILIKQLVITV